MQIAVLGIDLGKNSCSIVGLDVGGAVVLRRRTRREGIIKLAAKLKPFVVAMEACCGAHHLGRVLQAQGHKVRLMSPSMSALTSNRRRTTIVMRKRSPRRQLDQRCDLLS